uniref:Uncharacterized protein n=1 Tax=Sphaerodactylus townsendi TaxID=933632 RepID=A0ACB8G9H3_9SAUR
MGMCPEPQGIGSNDTGSHQGAGELSGITAADLSVDLEKRPGPPNSTLWLRISSTQEEHLQKVKNSQRPQHSLGAENQSLQQEVQKLKSMFSQLAKNHFQQQLVDIIHCLQSTLDAFKAENQQLRQEVQNLQSSQQALLAENQQLQEELQRKYGKKTQVPEDTAPQVPSPESTDFPVQVLVRGETGGCEKQILDDVTKLLVGQEILLQAEDYKENSKHLLLLFCSVATNMAADVNNCLKGLEGVPKILLVVLHHKPKDAKLFFPNSQLQVLRPALIVTVHARFSMQDGFYHCKANEDAVASVAAAVGRLLHVGN